MDETFFAVSCIAVSSEIYKTENKNCLKISPLTIVNNYFFTENGNITETFVKSVNL